MRLSLRRAATILMIATAGAVTCVAAPAASAAQRLETFKLPSRLGFADPRVVELNGVSDLNASVLLPDGYDTRPAQRWPVLYLLHGGADNSSVWSDPLKGDIRRSAAGFPGIVVMTEGGRGSYVDAWLGGARNGPRWTQYYLDEVIPAIEARYRIRSGRQYHAIGGLSMGASGALFLGGQLPGYFGTTIAMSGLLDLQSFESVAANQLASTRSYADRFGSLTGPYAQAHNPLRTIDNVADSQIYLSSGNGIVDPALPNTLEGATAGGLTEFRVNLSTIQYVAYAALAGARPKVDLRFGVHDWPYWRGDLVRAIRWGVFQTPPAPETATNRDWRYITMEPRGNAWGLGYRFAAPTQDVVRFERRGQLLRATGSGTVTIAPGAADADASGNGSRGDCPFTARIPFARTLPAGC